MHIWYSWQQGWYLNEAKISVTVHVANAQISEQGAANELFYLAII